MNLKRSAVAVLASLFVMVPNLRLQAQQKAALQAQVSSAETVSFDVYLPQRHRAERDQMLAQLQDPSSAYYHQWLTPAEFDAKFGPKPAVVRAIEDEMSSYGLTTTALAPRLLRVSGPAADVQQALGTTLSHGVMPNGKGVIVAASPLTLPGALTSVGAVVTGLSGKARMHSHAVRVKPDNRYSIAGPYWFDDLKQAYDWPSYKVLNGKGSTIGILIDGSYSQADMNDYFGYEGLTPPAIKEIDVLGGSPFDPNGDSVEAELDIQQSGGMAPNAKIRLYSIPDLSDDSIIAGLAQIIQDNKADVVSMSFGGPELFYTATYNGGVDYTALLLAEDDLMAEGNMLGITFVASSGDAGALPAPPLACFSGAKKCGSFQASAEFPASSPHVTGVGGTNLGTTNHPNNPNNLDSSYVYEEAFANPLTADIFYGTYATGGYWGSGGGDSIVFSKPDYQQLVTTGNKKMRTVPDLALHMGGCPADAECIGEESADIAVVGQAFDFLIGTSASAPDFAGLTALNVENLGTRIGNENPYIYTLAAAQASGSLPYPAFHSTVPGFNGLYTSGAAGYNRVLGNGTLYGQNFLLLPRVQAAGKPQTPSNP